jgi:hypothetical protein
MKWLVPFLMLCCSVRGADWYLDAAATGSNNGTSQANAWANTTNIVWSSVASGDTLWIQGGSYEGLHISGKSGITVRIATNATEHAIFGGTVASQLYDVDDTTLDGWLGGTQMFKFVGLSTPHIADSSVFRLRLCQGTTIRGVEIDRSALYNLDDARIDAMSINNSSAPANDLIVVEDCYFHHVTSDGININTSGSTSGWGRYIVRRTRITNTMDDAMQIAGNVIVEDCYFDKAGEVPKFGGHQDGVQVAKNATYTRISGCTMIGYGQNVFLEENGGATMVYNNVFIGDGATSGSQRGIAAGVTLVTTNLIGPYVIANNLMVNFVTYYGSTFGVLPSMTNDFIHIGNNIYVDCKRVSTGETLLDDSNIYWDTPGVQYYGTGGSPESIPGDRQAGSSRNLDPMIVSLGSRDFRPMAGSPAIGTGNSFAEFFTTDITGATRTGTWDVGPYKYRGLRSIGAATLNANSIVKSP